MGGLGDRPAIAAIAATVDNSHQWPPVIRPFQSPLPWVKDVLDTYRRGVEMPQKMALQAAVFSGRFTGTLFHQVTSSTKSHI
jgi:hypothetical protein